MDIAASRRVRSHWSRYCASALTVHSRFSFLIFTHLTLFGTLPIRLQFFLASLGILCGEGKGLDIKEVDGQTRSE